MVGPDDAPAEGTSVDHHERTRLLDRAAGALVGLAAGDALGAPWEFSRPDDDEPVAPIGGGPFALAPGEWTDDTAQAVAIALEAADGPPDPLAVGDRFLAWFAAGPPDVGTSTRAVLAAADGDAARLTGAAARFLSANPRRGAGNGALMRTAPVALAHLGDDVRLVERATTMAALTHADPLAADACVLWCVGIDRAVRQERLDGVREAVGLLDADRRSLWDDALDEAERRPSSDFRHGNGFVVTALQAAWSVLHDAEVGGGGGDGGRDGVGPAAVALEAAVRIGGDTDTIAAITGQLAGARWGASTLPRAWVEPLHGWPGLQADDLVDLATRSATAALGLP